MNDLPHGTRTAPPPPSSPASRVVSVLPGGVVGLGTEIGGMTQLAGQVLWSAVRYPVGYWTAVRDELYRTIRLIWLPMVASVFCFGMFIGILGLTFMLLIGANYLYGPLMLVESMRDFSIWINAMVVAGVVGAAVTADLGARRIREEIDALEVLGIDPVRSLIVPQVVSTTILTALLSIVSVAVAIADSAASTSFMGHMSAGVYFSNVFNDVTPAAVVSFFVDSILCGFIIAVVCAYKGFYAKGGSIGVGRAVNQAVVISFVGIWVLQFFYSAIVLGLFPAISDTAR